MNQNTIIIDGKATSKKILISVKKDIEYLRTKYGILPKLGLIQVGDVASSNLYIKNKKTIASSLNIIVEHLKFGVDISESKLLESIIKINQDTSYHGIIVQLPIPKHINPNKIAQTIDPRKDVDGFNPINTGNLLQNQPSALVPCTALGCVYLLQEYVGDITGKNITIIGRSNIVGRPLAALLVRHNATVTLCHSYTFNLKQHTQNADIVISAIGSPKKFDSTYFTSKSIFIDVGISYFKNKYVGDGDFNDLNGKIAMLTPVPGGVGSMTIAFLMSNIVQAAKNLL